MAALPSKELALDGCWQALCAGASKLHQAAIPSAKSGSAARPTDQRSLPSVGGTTTDQSAPAPSPQTADGEGSGDAAGPTDESRGGPGAQQRGAGQGFWGMQRVKNFALGRLPPRVSENVPSLREIKLKRLLITIVELWLQVVRFGLGVIVDVCSMFVPPILRVLVDLYPFKDADWLTYLMPELPDFYRGKTAWVTGASTGIGASLSRALARRGVAGLILTSRNVDDLQKLKRQIGSLKGMSETDILVLPGDLSQIEAIGDLVKKAIEFRGEVHLLFNNAGAICYELLPQWKETDEVLKLDLLAPMKISEEILPHMLAVSKKTAEPGVAAPGPRDCSIVYSNSVAASLPMMGLGGYNASKQGLRAYADALEAELRGRGEHPSIIGCDDSDAVSPSVLSLVTQPWAWIRWLTGLSQVYPSGAPARRRCGVSVTSLRFGFVSTSLGIKRLSSGEARDPGVHPEGQAGRSGPSAENLQYIKEGLPSDDAAERALAAVSNGRSTACIGRFEIMGVAGMRYASGFMEEFLRLLNVCSSWVCSDEDKRLRGNAATRVGPTAEALDLSAPASLSEPTQQPAKDAAL